MGEVSKYYWLHFSVQRFDSQASPITYSSNLCSVLNSCARDDAAILRDKKGLRHKQDKGMFTGIVLAYLSYFKSPGLRHVSTGFVTNC